MNDPVLMPPIERFYDLNRLSDAGYETTIAPGPEERAKLAHWADVSDVNQFEGRVSLRRTGPTRFSYIAHLEARITQPCAVTLEPVCSTISKDFTRVLQLVPQLKKLGDFSGELAPGAGEDEAPEEIESTRYDLAAPLLEEFLLAIEPFPRAPGVVFEGPAEEGEAKESPFAALKGWKSQG